MSTADPMPEAPVVIIEDDPFDVLLLSNSLSAVVPDCPVVVCEDGAEAIARLQALTDPLRIPRLPPPRAIFVDLNLPRVDGFALIRWIRQEPRLADLTVIVVSGSDRDADVQAAYECGADEFIRKPADTAVLRSLLLTTA